MRARQEEILLVGTIGRVYQDLLNPKRRLGDAISREVQLFRRGLHENPHTKWFREKGRIFTNVG